MTLSEWQSAYPSTRLQVFAATGARWIPIGPNDPGYRDLFHLSDWIVSSVSAGVVWLCPVEAGPSTRDALLMAAATIARLDPDASSTRGTLDVIRKALEM